MRQLWLYDWMSRSKFLNYRGKIMLMAFVGTHIPLLAIIGFFAFSTVADAGQAWRVFGIALVATLLGTGLTLFILNALLQPIVLTSRGLRSYRADRRLPDLPTGYRDEAGTLMADAAATLTDLDQAIDHLSNYDRVTGLPNRARLLDEIDARRARGVPFAVATLRLTHYDELVTAFDQQTADKVVWNVGRRLAAALRGDHFIARIEAGTFGFIMGDHEGTEGITGRIDQLLTRLSAEPADRELQLMPELTAGVALWPEDGADTEGLLDSATAALGESASGARVNFFSVAARDAARQRFMTAQELRRAIDRDELVLHYQPIVDLRLGRAIGAEALVRWQHPERGLLPPAAFVPIAEASGLDGALGHWVLRAGAERLAAWKSSGLGDLRLSINVSAGQFLDPSLQKQIDEALRDFGVSPDRLELELTETAAMIDRDRTAETFRKLRNAGLQVAIDDFGTGYSSMSQLRKLSFDKLKIDREFVSAVDRDEKSRAICAAIIELARGLGIATLAEGTEQVEEVRHLHELGCVLFQGYYFSRPVAADAFAEAARGLNIGQKTMSAVGAEPERRSA